MLLVVPLVLIVALLPGCLPVNEPLSDPDKAEPDKRLVGKWQGGKWWGCDIGDCEIDFPDVKGNPKGLMRAVKHKGEIVDEATYWFFTTKIDKNTYATICFESRDDRIVSPDFREEGAFEKWKKGDRRYEICRYKLDEEKLTIHFGDDNATKKLMQAEKIEDAGSYFKTPPGWLAKYLEKNGPETLYDGTYKAEWVRAKK
jgi:hypothetical protein